MADLEWCLYEVIGQVAARLTHLHSSPTGRLVGYPKLHLQELAGFTWFYKQCDSEHGRGA